MSVLVTGSVAIDHIMVFEDRFKNHILPDQIHILNVAFAVPTLERRCWRKARQGRVRVHEP